MSTLNAFTSFKNLSIIDYLCLYGRESFLLFSHIFLWIMMESEGEIYGMILITDLTFTYEQYTLIGFELLVDP